MIYFYKGFSGFVAKILKYFNKFILPYTWSITITWLNFISDDLEKHHKFDNS
jgi:hypothetical protein